MSTERETARAVRSWLEEGVTRLPDRVLDSVLDQVPATPQRRRFWSARRPNQMNTYAKLAAAAAAVAVIAIIGYQFLPGRVPGSGGPTVAPSPTTAALIARGTFGILDGEMTLNAMRQGENVTGTMTFDHVAGDFAVDLKCSTTTEGGVIILAGDIVESASPYAKVGRREVLVLAPGPPIQANLDTEEREGGPLRPAATCPELLQQAVEAGMTRAGDGGIGPIDSGTIEFGP